MKERPVLKWSALIALFIVAMSLFAQPTWASPSLSERFEKALGKGTVLDVLDQYGGEHAVPFQKRLWVEEVFRRLVQVTKRTGVEYNLTVLDSQEWNAFSLPGGYIFITKGLLKMIGDDEAKLAAVLGHEIAHVENKHGLNAVLRQMGLTVLIEVGVFWLDVLSADVLRVASATLLQLLQLGWGREAEFEADLDGQRLAVEAGFDGIGAVRLLEDILELESDNLSLQVFRSHPDTFSRRERVAGNLINFWSKPQILSPTKTAETVIFRRDSLHRGRIDPRSRYTVTIAKKGLQIQDAQQNTIVSWLEDHEIYDFQWSPQGEFLVAIAQGKKDRVLLLCDRLGHIVKRWEFTAGNVESVSWSPQGEMIAFAFDDGSSVEVFASYVEGEALIPVSRGKGGRLPVWGEDGLYFLREDSWHVTAKPSAIPVVVTNPVPLVIQRKRILQPTVVREGNTIRLTRPALTPP